MFRRLLAGSASFSLMSLAARMFAVVGDTNLPPNSGDHFHGRRSGLKPNTQQYGRSRRPVWREPEMQRVVSGMTNHERNLWAAAGYPGLKKVEVAKIADWLAACRRRLDARRAA